MSVPPLRVAAARYALHLVDTDDLIQVADELLTRGIYSYSLGELYTLGQRDLDQAGRWFRAALKELGVPFPTEEKAASILLRHYVRCIIEGRLSPEVNLYQIAGRGFLRSLSSISQLECSAEIDRLLSHYYRFDELEWRVGAEGIDAHQARRERESLDADVLRDAVDWHQRHGSPPIQRAWLQWNDGTVAKIAYEIAHNRRFSELPVLADALEEAGCDVDEVLEHCRWQQEHPRGCWVIDLLVGEGGEVTRKQSPRRRGGEPRAERG